MDGPNPPRRPVLSQHFVALTLENVADVKWFEVKINSLRWYSAKVGVDRV